MQMLEAHRPDGPTKVHSGYLTGPLLGPLPHPISRILHPIARPLSLVQCPILRPGLVCSFVVRCFRCRHATIATRLSEGNRGSDLYSAICTCECPTCGSVDGPMKFVDSPILALIS